MLEINITNSIMLIVTMVKLIMAKPNGPISNGQINYGKLIIMVKLTKAKPIIVKLIMVKLFIIIKLLMANLTIIKLNMAQKMM
jgi:hypothetical protein